MTAPAGQAVGIGRVLAGVRQPGEVREPHVVEFRDVTKTFNAGQSNEFTAIHNVTFVVEDLVDKGEFICMLGPSGSGKSTILRLIAGLRPQHPPTIGRSARDGGKSQRPRRRPRHGFPGLHEL